MEENKLMENTIRDWDASVKRFCEKRGLQEIDLKRMHEADDYKIYCAYKDVMFWKQQYERVPESFVYENKLIDAISLWYRVTGTSIFTMIRNFMRKRQK